MNHRSAPALRGRALRCSGFVPGRRRLAVAVTALVVFGGVSGSVSAQPLPEPLLPASCMPITGPNHGNGNQYEVRFRMLRNCDEAVAAFRQIVGQTPPERPRNSPIRWWDVGAWRCEGGAGGRVMFFTACEQGENRLSFLPIPQALASPTTILTGMIPDGVSDARVLVNGSTLADEACVVSGPSVSFSGRTVSKWMLTAKSPDGSVGCAFAQTWLSRMVRQTGLGPSRSMAVAPRGWRCFGTAVRQKAVLGVCEKSGTNGASTFGWSPAPN